MTNQQSIQTFPGNTPSRPQISMSDACNPISSKASLRAVSATSISLSSTIPPGKLTEHTNQICQHFQDQMLNNFVEETDSEYFNANVMLICTCVHAKNISHTEKFLKIFC